MSVTVTLISNRLPAMPGASQCGSQRHHQEGAVSSRGNR
jgi:hypothetical protein